MNGSGFDDQNTLIEIGLDGTIAASTAVILAIAELENQSPVDLDAGLYEAVDVDALDRVIQNCPSDLSVAFPYGGYRVRFENDHLFVDHVAEK
jgi:hypothetical protein